MSDETKNICMLNKRMLFFGALETLLDNKISCMMPCYS